MPKPSLTIPLMAAVVAAMTILTAPGFTAEQKLTGGEIQKILAGHMARGESGGKISEQIFQADGNTFFSLSGAQSQGRWEVRGDQYCSQWPPSEAWSCYDLTIAGKTYTFVSKSGTRSPVEIEN